MGIRKRGDKWLVTVETGRDATGKRRRHCSTHATEDEAKKAEVIARAKVAQDEWVDESEVSLDAFLERWLEHRKRDLTYASYLTYERRVNGLVHKHLGELKLRKLRATHIVAFEAKLYEAGRSASTVRKYRMMLHGALRTAVKWGLIANNPAHGLDPIRCELPEVRWLNATEQAKLLNKARCDHKGQPNRLYLPILLALATGVRKGELLALRWSDIDLAKNRVTVRRSLQRGESAPTYRQGGKGGKGRVVALPETLVPLLTAHRNEQALHRKTAGTAWQDHDLVFCGALGEPLNADGFQSTFERLRGRAKLPTELHFHCLRHTYATEMLLAGVHPKIVSEALGHTTVKMTLDRYSHAIPHLQTEAAALMDTRLRALLGP